MPLVASQVIGLVMLRYVLELEPLASMDPDLLVATYAPTLQRYLDRRTCRPLDDRRAVAACIIQHMMKNAIDGARPRGDPRRATRCCAGSTSRSPPGR